MLYYAVLFYCVAVLLLPRLTKVDLAFLLCSTPQVRAKQQRPADLEGLPYEFNETPLEVWWVLAACMLSRCCSSCCDHVM